MTINAKELIKVGKLSEARKQLIDEIKVSPSDMSKRTLLFQVLAFCGEWDKADRHLDVIALQDASVETGVQVYKNLILAEKERLEVLKRNQLPSFLPKAPPYLEMYLAAWDNLTNNEYEKALELYKQIESSRPSITGTIDGKGFTGFSNMDAFLSLFLEVMVHERYIWVPFDSLKELIITPPKSLFDLLWTTAHLTTWEGLNIGCYLPVLYPQSCLHEDERVKMGRMTDWVPLQGPFYSGRGQHVFQVGEEEKALLEIQNLLFESPVEGTAE